MSRGGRAPAHPAKLSPPRLARIHPRLRLFRRLDAASRGSVVWVTGPPGAGKTALVASWLSRRRLRPLWLQLDAGDADPAAFFRWLSGAMPAAARRTLPRFGPEHVADPVGFARDFARRLRAAIGRGKILVLDDWSEVGRDGPLDRVLRELLRELGGSVGVVVTSRTGPPPALARLRATGVLHMLDGVALALTRQEAGAVARLWGASTLTPAALVERTGGWAAGIALLAASRARGGDGAPPQEVFDFLAWEVFDRAPLHVREALQRLSLVPRIDAAAAARLARDPRASDILARLARGGWFVQRHPGEAPSYQFHPLVREFLAARARSALGEQAFQELMLDSARAMEEAGSLADAVVLLRDARAHADIARVVLTSASGLLQAGAARTLAEWIDLLPAAMIDGDPWLLHWRAAARLFTSPELGLADAERAFDRFVHQGDATGAYLSWVTAVQILAYAIHDDHEAFDRWLDALEMLRARFAAWPAPELEAAVVSGAVLAYMFRRPQDSTFTPWLERALEIALSPGDPRARLDAGCHVFAYTGAMGANLDRARVVLAAARPLLADGRVRVLDQITWTAAEAFLRIHSGDAEGALADARRGLELGAQHGLHHWKGPLLSARMLAELALDRFSSARASCDQLAAAVRREGRLSQVGYLNSACNLALRTGATRAAAEHGAAAVALAEQAGSVHPAAVAHVQHAVALERLGVPALAEAARYASGVGQAACEYGALAAMGVIALERGDEDAAADAIARALTIADRAGVRWVVWLSRAELSEVCAFALQRGIAPAVALDTIRACRLPPGPRARHLVQWPWRVRVEALSGLSVLRDGTDRGTGKAQRKPLELLKLLVVHGERGGSFDALAEALWPDADGDVAHHALETTVYRLRRLLGDAAAVVRRAGRLALDPDRVFVDAWGVEALAARAEELHARGDAAGALRAATAARELYRGDLLPDDDVAELARARLRARVERLGVPGIREA